MQRHYEQKLYSTVFDIRQHCVVTCQVFEAMNQIRQQMDQNTITIK